MNKQYKTYSFKSEPLWEEVPEGRLEFSNWDSKIHYDTRFRMCFVREKGIFLRMKTNETDLRAVNTSRDENVWEDSCMEFFLCPIAHRGEYLNFEMNSKGAWLCQFGSGKYDRVFLKALTDREIDIHTSVCSDGWRLEAFIPCELISEAFTEEFVAGAAALKGNFYKCGDLTEKPHYDSFSKMTTLPPGFHNPDCFAKILISER
ncbi:MAG: carbohydrate-binding family 9-like protein [Clostridia bacterium]|nr:carbohydrate-binding family 9-like protein [Clostridia bacterium]